MSDPALVVDASPVSDKPRRQWWRIALFAAFACGYLTLWGWGWAWLWVWIFDPTCR